MNKLNYLICLSSLIATSSIGFAQSDSTSDEDVYELSPFEVNTSADVGYLANNTLAGSRLNTDLMKTPATISVFNQEFLNDLAALNTEDVLNYAVNASRDFDTDTGAFVTGNNLFDADLSIRIRGHGGGGLTRNFFVWGVNADNYNVERIDSSRGPNSILFGIASPGGIFNTSTKRAQLMKDMTNAVVQIDENGSIRATGDVNRVINDQFAIRINVLGENGKTWRNTEKNDKRFVHIAGTYAFNEKVRLHAEFETGTRDMIFGRPWLYNDGFSNWVKFGMPTVDVANGDNGSVWQALDTVNDAYTYIANTGQAMVLKGTKKSAGSWAWAQSDLGAGLHSKSWALAINDLQTFNPEDIYEGPSNGAEVSVTNFTTTLEAEIIENLNVEASYNYQSEDRDTILTTNWVSYYRYDPNQTNPDGTQNPFLGDMFAESAFQKRDRRAEYNNFRVTAAYEFDLGNVWGNHSIAAMYQISKEDRSEQTYEEFNIATDADDWTNNSTNRIIRRTYIRDPYGRGSSDLPSGMLAWKPINSNGIVSDFLRTGSKLWENENQSMMVAMQNRFWEDRISAIWGYRNDELDLGFASRGKADGADNHRIAPVARNVASAENYSGDTYTMGVTVFPIDWLGFAINKSNNISPQNVQGPLDSLGNMEGETLDYSVRLNFGSKLYSTLTFFDTQQQNRSSFIDSVIANRANLIQEILTGNDNYYNGSQDTIDTVSEGYELEIVANPTENWNIRLAYSATDMTESNIYPRWFDVYESNRSNWAGNSTLNPEWSGDPNDLERTVADLYNRGFTALQDAVNNSGNPPRNHVENNGNLFTMYRFKDGSLDNLRIGGGLRYRGSTFLGVNPWDGEEITIGEEYYFDLVLGYKTSLFDNKIGLDLQLNVSNLTDNSGVIPLAWDYRRGLGDSRDGEVVITRYRFETPRLVKLTARFSF